MNNPTAAEFEAAFQASQQVYQELLLSIEKAIGEDNGEKELHVILRAYILAFFGNCYDARLRVHLKKLSKHHTEQLYTAEANILAELLHKQQQNDTSDSKKNNRMSVRVEQPSRPLSPSAILLTGVGAAFGGAAVAMTAGLAAPFILPAIAAALGSAALAGGTSIAAIATVCGAAGAGWSGYKVSKHFYDIAGMSLHPISNTGNTDKSGITGNIQNEQQALGLTICVSGWYTDRKDLPAHWSVMAESRDSAVVLEYEAELMESLGNLWEEMAMSTVASVAVGEALKTTVIGSALAAIAWPLTLLQLGNMVDHPWWLAVGRSRKCGVALARMLHDRRVQGARPVSLFGVSMGAIVVQCCLEELSRLGSFGVVENVVLLGLPSKLPAPSKLERWRRVVAGRFVHGYSRNDWLLRFLFRTTRLHVGQVAGLVPWDVEGVESVDLTNLVGTHTEFRDKLDEILLLLNLV